MGRRRRRHRPGPPAGQACPPAGDRTSLPASTRGGHPVPGDGACTAEASHGTAGPAQARLRGEPGGVRGCDMTKPVPTPPARFATDRAFQDEVRNRPDALVYFLCNVGDGDAQVLLLPQGEGGSRQVAIVDAAINDKVPNLLDLLVQEQLVSLQPGPGGAEPIVLVVATHPHQDHIGGMPQVLDRFGPLIAEFWDPGYFHTITAYHGIMQRVEA